MAAIESVPKANFLSDAEAKSAALTAIITYKAMVSAAPNSDNKQFTHVNKPCSGSINKTCKNVGELREILDFLPDSAVISNARMDSLRFTVNFSDDTVFIDRYLK